MPPTHYPPAESPEGAHDITAPRHDPTRPEERELPAFNPTTARAITHIVRCIRPAWSQDDVMAAVMSCGDLPLSEVVHAAVNLATDARVDHPSRLPHAGAHWGAAADELVSHRHAVSEIARGRDTSTWVSHSTPFLTRRCRAYLAQCRDRGAAPDQIQLASYAAQGVDVAELVAEVYRD